MSEGGAKSNFWPAALVVVALAAIAAVFFLLDSPARKLSACVDRSSLKTSTTKSKVSIALKDGKADSSQDFEKVFREVGLDCFEHARLYSCSQAAMNRPVDPGVVADLRNRCFGSKPPGSKPVPRTSSTAPATSCDVGRIRLLRKTSSVRWSQQRDPRCVSRLSPNRDHQPAVQFSIDLKVGADERLRAPQLTCETGHLCSWSRNLGTTVHSDQHISGRVEVWTRPMTWRLCAQVEVREEREVVSEGEWIEVGPNMTIPIQGDSSRDKLDGMIGRKSFTVNLGEPVPGLLTATTRGKATYVYKLDCGN